MIRYFKKTFKFKVGNSPILQYYKIDPALSQEWMYVWIGNKWVQSWYTLSFMKQTSIKLVEISEEEMMLELL